MSLPLAAYPEVVNVAADSSGSAGAYSPMGGLNKNDFGPKATLVDSTYFGGTGAVSRFPTLVDADLSMSGQFSPGAASNVVSADPGQEIVMISVGSTNPYVWVQIFWTGTTHGFSIRCLVESFKLSSAVAGVIEYSASIKAVAKPTYV